MRIERNGVAIGYDSYGPDDAAATLVLLHAFPLSRGQWRAQGESLARATELRVVAPDLRGCGESSVIGPAATMEQMADDTLTLLDALGIAQVALGGLSMGGYVALAALRAWPERIRALILADTRASADTAEAQAGREATARFVAAQGPAALFERDAAKLLSNHALTRQPEVVAQARELAEANSAAGLATVARGLALRPDAMERLPQIDCPTLVMVGEQDAITPVADARVLFERIPHTQLEVIPDAGHLSNLERPAIFTDLLARFLRETGMIAS